MLRHQKAIAPIPRYWISHVLFGGTAPAIHGASLSGWNKRHGASPRRRPGDPRPGGSRVEEDIIFFPWTRGRGSAEDHFGIRLCGRTPEEDLLLDGRHTYMNLDGNGMEILISRPESAAPPTSPTTRRPRGWGHLEQIGNVAHRQARTVPSRCSPFRNADSTSQHHQHDHDMTVRMASAPGGHRHGRGGGGGREGVAPPPAHPLFESVPSPLRWSGVPARRFSPTRGSLPRES
jgi:hypothetical protein